MATVSYNYCSYSYGSHTPKVNSKFLNSLKRWVQIMRHVIRAFYQRIWISSVIMHQNRSNFHSFNMFLPFQHQTNKLTVMDWLHQFLEYKSHPWWCAVENENENHRTCELKMTRTASTRGLDEERMRKASFSSAIVLCRWTGPES